MFHIISALSGWQRLGDDFIGGFYIMYRILKEALVS
jgi:hypothetical protein